jgi:probable F420-dependent oxidoreductase
VWAHGTSIDPELAGELEGLGYGAIWLGGSPGDGLEHVEALLDATETITVATGIVNIWTTDPTTLAESYHRIAHRIDGRFIVGVGAGHPESSGTKAEKPFEAMIAYLDELEAGGVPNEVIVLAALGPRMLRLARERTAGAHPYLVTPEHTAEARAILGKDRLLAPEQRVVLRDDPEAAREVGRPTVVTPYLQLINYRRSLERLGFTEDDLAENGSDALIDTLVVSGDDATVASRLRAHLEAGADHVAVQLLLGDGDDPVDGYSRIAAAVLR